MEIDEVTMHDCDKAITMMNTGRTAEAAIAFTEILTKKDDVGLAWNNRGLALLQLGHPFDAVLNIEKAIALEPKCAEFYLNLGAAYIEFEQMDKGIAATKQAIALNPKLAHAYMNMGNALKYQGKIEESLPAYDKCVEADPTYVDGHLVRAFANLALGNYKIGWDEFEWRWKSNQLVPRGLPLPQWDGEDLTGKRLLIYGEQGHGDSLQFVRYAPMVKAKYDCKVFFEVRQPCVRLFKTSFPELDGVLTFGEKIDASDFDYMIPVMSLPRIFGTTVDTIPASESYFKADPYRKHLWAKRLEMLPPGMLVGICWAGLSRPGRIQAEIVDKRRSTTLSEFAPLAKVPGISWVSLVKGGSARSQVELPPAGMTIGDWTDELDDFYDTAALIANLDLVITVDTAVVHLAAALGKPTWLLSRWDGCWRWLGTRADSPWYPSLRQFTQPAPHAWGPMMEAVAVALRQRVQERSKKAA